MHVIDGEEIRALSARLGPFSTRGGPFRLLLPPTCPPASTTLGGGLPGNLPARWPACPVACSRARAAGINAKACEIG